MAEHGDFVSGIDIGNFRCFQDDARNSSGKEEKQPVDLNYDTRSMTAITLESWNFFTTFLVYPSV